MQVQPHYVVVPDDEAIDLFAAAMKAKLARARERGRGGWNDPDQCSASDLSGDLRVHVSKGDPVDVANFCMMLWMRDEQIVKHMPALSPGMRRDLTQAIDIQMELRAEREEMERRRAKDRRSETREAPGRRRSDMKD